MFILSVDHWYLEQEAHDVMAVDFISCNHVSDDHQMCYVHYKSSEYSRTKLVQQNFQYSRLNMSVLFLCFSLKNTSAHIFTGL